MNKVKGIDPKQLRRLIQKDGLPYPKRFHESDPQSYDIVNIGHNVKSNIDVFMEDMDKAAEGLSNFTSIGDFCFEEYEFAWRPRRYIYRGDTPRPTRRPLKNFLRTVLHIKRFKSDEELQEEERAIREILVRYPDRLIKIYSMNSLMAYLAASPGVTVGPSDILQNLRVDRVERKYKSYRSSRKYFVKKLEEKGNDLIKVLTAWQQANQQVIGSLGLVTENVAPVRTKNAWDKLRLKTLRSVYLTTQSHLNKLMIAYWDFKLMNDDCFHFLFEYLLAHISDFCKLNPPRQPKRKSKAKCLPICH